MLEKVKKYLLRISETDYQIQRHQKNIADIEEERRALIEKDALQWSNDTTIQDSRKMRGCLDRLAKEEKDLENARMKLEILNKSALGEGEEIRKAILNNLSKGFSDAIKSCENKNAEIGRIKSDLQKAVQDYHRLDLEKEAKNGQLRNFNRQWDAQKVIRLLSNPTSDEFTKGCHFVVQQLGGYVSEQWQREQDKRSAELAEAREKSDKEHQAKIKKNREYYEKAMRICSGKEPMPPELAVTYSHNDIPLNVLEDFLKRKEGVK